MHPGKIGVEMNITPSFWNNRRVFLTGHTGFKGSWLSLWLQSLGANIRGYALSPPTKPSLFIEAKVDMNMDSVIGDIRDAESLTKAISEFKPEVIFHMAAQPLVRESYIDPLLTYQTNVMGTVNLFEAVRKSNSIRCVINITTDKCYENREWLWSYRENDSLGGYDPYSSSKACSELVTSAYRQSFFQSNNTAVATARAGNVIGGGDWATDRLIPDIINAFNAGQIAFLRNPSSIRPWQHVLEPLHGYLKLAEHLAGTNGMSFAEAWNFGPHESDTKRVDWIANYMVNKWDTKVSWRSENKQAPHEAKLLKLDSSKSRERLGWVSRWNLSLALDAIVEWNHLYRSGADIKNLTLSQINRYEGRTA